MDPFIDPYSRAVIYNMVNSAHVWGQHSFGLYKVKDLFKLNISLHLQAARMNRYSHQMSYPTPSLEYKTPYVYFCYIGMGTLEMIPLHEYDSAVSIDTLERMLKSGEIKLGKTVFAPSPFDGVPIMPIEMPD